MCTSSCFQFGLRNIKEENVKEKMVIEVGAYDINGSYRPIVEALCPASYTGVDIQEGSGVDEVCDANCLIERFGPEKFDLLISTEVIEHIRDWRKAISNFKNILKPGGVLLVTTRSKGFWYHGWPYDYWRYEVEDLQTIFSDFDIEKVEKDTYLPGVFIKARKPESFEEKPLLEHKLYSILRRKRVGTVRDIDIFATKIMYPLHRLAPRILPTFVKRFIKNRTRRKFLENA